MSDPTTPDTSGVTNGQPTGPAPLEVLRDRLVADRTATAGLARRGTNGTTPGANPRRTYAIARATQALREMYPLQYQHLLVQFDRQWIREHSPATRKDHR
jgi:hypothetical protein